MGFWVKNGGRGVSVRGLGKIGKKNMVKKREKCGKPGKIREKFKEIWGKSSKMNAF